MILRTGNKGFTLLEVMIATAVLSLGSLLVYQAFFISLDSFDYYSKLLKVIPWMDQNIWEAQDNLMHFGPAAQMQTEGELKTGDKNIMWNLSYGPVSETNRDLYQVDLALSWQQGRRNIKLSRSAYAIYLEK